MQRFIRLNKLLTDRIFSRALSSNNTDGKKRRGKEVEFRRFAVEMGTGTSLRREDHTAASVRAVQDALWRISLTAYRALDKDPAEMKVNVIIGVPKPDQVDKDAVLALVPYGDLTIDVQLGGLSIPGGCGADAQGNIIMANAAVQVDLDVGDYLAFKKRKQETST